MGKIGGAAAGFIPGVGPGLSKVIGAIAEPAGALADTLGGAAQGRAQGTLNADLSAQGRDRLALQRAELANKYGLDSTQMGNVNAQKSYEDQMAQAKYRMDAPSIRAEQARKGDLLANVQDVVASHPRADIVHFQGGIRPSALGPNAREAGRLLSSGAVDAMRSGEQLPTSPTFSGAPAPMVPTLSTAPQSGFMDKLLGGAAMGSSILGAVSPYFNRQNPFFERNMGNASQVPPPGQAAQIPGSQPPRPFDPLLESTGIDKWRMY